MIISDNKWQYAIISDTKLYCRSWQSIIIKLMTDCLSCALESSVACLLTAVMYCFTLRYWLRPCLPLLPYLGRLAVRSLFNQQYWLGVTGFSILLFFVLSLYITFSLCIHFHIPHVIYAHGRGLFFILCIIIYYCLCIVL